MLNFNHFQQRHAIAWRCWKWSKINIEVNGKNIYSLSDPIEISLQVSGKTLKALRKFWVRSDNNNMKYRKFSTCQRLLKWTVKLHLYVYYRIRAPFYQTSYDRDHRKFKLSMIATGSCDHRKFEITMIYGAYGKTNT